MELEWDAKIGQLPLTLLARAGRRGGSQGGTQLDLRLSAGVFSIGRVSAGVFAQATWANAKSAASLYDIAPQQAAASGMPAFSAGSGLLFAGIGVLVSVEPSREWEGSLEMRRLQGDAARSPLAERRSNHYFSAGPAYRF